MIGITNSNTSTIYVGPTEPTSGVRIWLDTDEDGASAVNSVNGKAGTVVLDLDDIGFAELLWTNASPTSTFAAQTISLDLSDYDMVLIENRANSTSATVLYRKVDMCVKGDMVVLQFILNSTGTATYQVNVLSRDATAQSNGIVFSDGYNKLASAAQGTQPTVENQRCVPIRIWGIKGVA